MTELKQYFQELLKVLQDSRLQYIAATLAYSTVLSLVPLIAVSLSIAKGMGVLDLFVDNVEPIIMGYLSAGAGPDAVKWLEKSVANISVGAMGVMGVATLLFIATKLLREIDIAIQIIWGTRKRKKSIIKRVLYYWLTIILGPIVVTAAFVITSSGQLKILGFLPAVLFSWVILTAIMTWIFKAVPNRKVATKTAASAASITSLALLIGQAIFNWATINVVNYDRIYGSLTSVFMFLGWILMVWYIALFGVALNAAMENYNSAKKA